jgi:hypothetical protein
MEIEQLNSTKLQRIKPKFSQNLKIKTKNLCFKSKD